MSALDRGSIDLNLDELELLVADDYPNSGAGGRIWGADRPVVRKPVAARSKSEQQSRWASSVATIAWRNVRNSVPFVATDLVSLVICGLAGYGVLKLTGLYPSANLWLSAVALFPITIAYWLGGLYTGIGMHPVIELRQIVRINTIALSAAAIASITASPLPVWCAVCLLISLPLIPLARTIVRRGCARQSWWGHPALIVSSGSVATAVAEMLCRAPSAGIRPVAISDPRGKLHAATVPIINDVVAVEKFIRSQAIRYVVVALPDFPHAQVQALIDQYSRLVPHTLVASDATALPSLWGVSRSCGRLSGMEISNGRMLTTLRLTKRALDLSVALICLLLVLPVMLVLMVLVKISSKGPFFYGHPRIGVDGERFVAWKFRTMYLDSERILKEHLARNPAAREEWEANHKLRDDPRVPRLGSFLRKWSLDELPQIWNVLRGNMSLVGPRPIVEAEAHRYGDTMALYTSVKPGITGLWQVSGRANTTYAERVLFDAYYVRNWSPWLDVYILARTVVTLLRRTGAY